MVHIWRTSLSNNSHALCVLPLKYYSRVSLSIKMSALYVVCLLLLLLLFLIFFLTLLLIILLLSLFFVIVVIIIIITVPFSWFIARAVNLSRKGSLIY